MRLQQLIQLKHRTDVLVTSKIKKRERMNAMKVSDLNTCSDLDVKNCSDVCLNTIQQNSSVGVDKTTYMCK